jgi:rhamnogalacturonan endolyase
MKTDSADPARENERRADSIPTDSEYSHTLYHNDLSALAPGPLTGSDLRQPVLHPSWEKGGTFRVIERGLGRYIETIGGSSQSVDRMLIAGDAAWNDYRLRAVVTPVSFDDGSPGGSLCGIVARYKNPHDYIALVLDADGQLKLLLRRRHGFDVLDARPLEFCLGQSLSLTLRVQGGRIQGTAGPYSGATHVFGNINHGAVAGCGRVGMIADVPARFGPFTVECTPPEAERIAAEKNRSTAAIAIKRKRIPKMKLERTIPLKGLVSGRNLRIVDVNGDGKPEIVVGQHSANIASVFSMTRLTALSVLDMNGALLWQSGVPDPAAPRDESDLPFQIYDLFGDGGNVVVCVHGYDIQVRDGRSGKVLFSGSTPDTATVGADFRELTSNFGKPWGDETLTMDVASIAFCNTLGNSGAREILIKDDCHHLAVIDLGFQQLFKHRGNHGNCVWACDLDGDGKDEIVAGYSLIDDDGKRLWSLPRGGYPSCVAVADLLNPEGAKKRLFVAAGDAGLYAVHATPARPAGDDPARIGNAPASHISIGKFRTDLPGLQLATVGEGGLVTLYDATLKRLWTRDIAGTKLTGMPVNWTGRGEELLLCGFERGSGLFDGFGDLVAEIPDAGAAPFAATTIAFSKDGRDCIAAWDEQQLSIYVPEDAVTADVYKPQRPTIHSSTQYAPRISLPPQWQS